MQPPEQGPGGQHGTGGESLWGTSTNGPSPGAPRMVTLPLGMWNVGMPLQEALQHAKATNPAVKSLASGLESLHSNLRSEAQQRLGGFKPPLPITNGITNGLNADDWDLLKRVGQTTGTNGTPNNNTPWGLQLGPVGAGPGSGGSFSMKRSASENSLESINNAAAHARKHSTSRLRPENHQGQQPVWGWEQVSPNPDNEASWPPSLVNSGAHFAQAHAAAMQAMTRRPVGLLTTAAEAERQQRLQQADGSDSDSSMGDGEQPRFPPWRRNQHGHAQQHGHSWAAGMDEQALTPVAPLHGRPGRGMPRVPTAPTLQEIGETLNWSATRNLEAVRNALQNAHASIQETATNCQQNLQTLSNIFQQNLLQSATGVTVAPGPAGPLQAALSNSRALVTWGISNSGDPLGGALVPWNVLPRTLRARELEAAQAAGGDSSKDAADARAGALNDWVTPLEQYINSVQQGQAGVLGSKRKGLQGRSIREPGRQVAIVTTASLPWLTGTAVNPLLRAAYLASDGSRKVTLVLPWLSPADQARVFPHDMKFDTPEQQEEYVRAWARQRTGLDCNFKVTFYPSRYAAEKGSILPVGDVTSVIPDSEADVAVLEEPEHLNWYHHGARWTDKFAHVVGVMHTNYLDYARREENGGMKELLLRHINAWVCRVHCHKVIKLSDAVQPLPREDTMFVHGVSPAFLRVGKAKAQAAQARRESLTGAHGEPDHFMATSTAATPASMTVGTMSAASGASGAPDEPLFGRGVYFLGKVLWAKGYTELLDRLNEHAQRTGEKVAVDVYGSGPDLKAVEEEAERRQLPMKFNGARDHADATLQEYKVFINPSLSDVVATTTAEALAMGKWVVCADHPSNRFFQRFPNCLIYKSSNEFSHCLKKALAEDPKPLSDADLHSLTWEAATERFLDVADGLPSTAPIETGMDNVLAALHNSLTGVEFLRVAMGAGVRTRDAPVRITDYHPDENDVGGFFDNAARAKKSWDGKSSKGGKAPRPSSAPPATNRTGSGATPAASAETVVKA